MGIHLTRVTTALSWLPHFPISGSTTKLCSGLAMRKSAAASWSLQRIRPHELQACVVGHADSCVLTTVSDTVRLNCRNAATVNGGLEARGIKKYSYMQHSAVLLSGFLAVNESPASAERKHIPFSLRRYLLLFSSLLFFFFFSFSFTTLLYGCDIACLPAKTLSPWWRRVHPTAWHQHSRDLLFVGLGAKPASSQVPVCHMLGKKKC